MQKQKSKNRKNESLKISFRDFKLTSLNPSENTIAIVALVLTFLYFMYKHWLFLLTEKKRSIKKKKYVFLRVLTFFEQLI